MSIVDDFPAQPTPLTEQVRITEIEEVGDDLHVLSHVTVDRNNPILAGHYPEQAVFPGVCLIECAHHTVLITARSLGFAPVMEAVSVARFKDTVLPGDTVSIHARITRRDAVWTAMATLHGERGLAAKVTLRYNLTGGVS